MTPAIVAENLGKCYQIGHQRLDRAQTFREALAAAARSAARQLLHPWRSAAGPRGAASIEEFWALRDISFSIAAGERVGIIGRNGAGKSTLLKILSRITEPSAGQVRIRGRVASLLEVGTGFHPELTGRENIFLNGAILGMSRAEIRRKFDAIVAFAEVERFLDTPVKRYSSGMYVRLAFAVAAHLEPEILIVDEVLAVGDAQFQQKCLGKMEEVGKEGRTVLFVSHNMAAIQKLCGRAIVLGDGAKIFDGETRSAIDSYLGRDYGDLDVKHWPAGARPALPAACLHEVGLLSGGNSCGVEIATEAPVQIYVKFEVTAEEKIGTTLLLYNSEGQLLLASLSNHEQVWHGKRRPVGMYESICEIPANTLAPGKYSVSVVFWQGHYERSITENHVLQFSAVEHGLVRGDLVYPLKGVLVMPLLHWTSRNVD